MLLAWMFTTIAAWFMMLLTGNYPQGLYEFGIGVLSWRLRDYPPFSLT